MSRISVRLFEVGAITALILTISLIPLYITFMSFPLLDASALEAK